MKTKILIVIAIIFLAISCAEEKKQTKKEETTSLDSVPRSKIEIIGAGPYSLDGNKENYKFHLLTSFSYATYELDPKTGNYKTILEWPTTPVIDSAKQQNAKTFLTLNNFGEKNNGLFLTNQKAQDASIKILEEILILHDANGVIVNFKHIPLINREAFSNYIIKLSDRLSIVNKEVLITIPGNNAFINSVGSFNFENLMPHVSYFIISNSDLTEGSLEYAGPISPLFDNEQWNHISVDRTLSFYSNGKIPISKLILTIPYFGSNWELIDDGLPSRKVKFIENVSYGKIMELNPQPIYEEQSQSAFFNFQKNGKNFQIWYDDPKTLRAKFDYVIDHNLGGVYLWGLENNAGYAELWDIIDEKLWRK